jgi:hypothetical protein
LEHAAPASIAEPAVDPVERPAAAPHAGRPADARTGLLSLVTDPATILVVLALAVAVGYFVLAISDYKNLFVHPDNHQRILRESLHDGIAIDWHELPNMLQNRQEGESRPRWLTYLFLSIDHKLRLWLYDWLPTHPTLAPAAWFFQAVVTSYYLYRLLLNVTGDRLAGLSSLALYWSATGFLSGFTMFFMPGKTLSNLILVLTLYAASEGAKRLKPGQLLVSAPGWSKYLALLTLLAGLFLDEMPIAVFLILPLMFWWQCVPAWPWAQSPGQKIGAFLKNAAFFAGPVVVFLVIVVVIAPPLTQMLWGYSLDYLGDTLLIHGNTRTAASLDAAVESGLDPSVIWGNISTLFGLSLAPWFTTPLVYTLNDQFPSGQVTNLPKLVTLVAFFGAAIFLAVKSKGPFAVHLRGLLVSLPLFFLFLSLLMVRHIPIVTGYYYGAIFASLFALLVAMMVTAVSRIAPWSRPVAALAVLAIVGIQVTNYTQLNTGWRIVHNEQLTRDRMAKAPLARDKRIPIAPEARELSRGEVQAIWAAWKADRLDRYLRENPASTGAVYEVVELQELDRARPRR